VVALAVGKLAGCEPLASTWVCAAVALSACASGRGAGIAIATKRKLALNAAEHTTSNAGSFA
jgi:hypothetical protein